MEGSKVDCGGLESQRKWVLGKDRCGGITPFYTCGLSLPG